MIRSDPKNMHPTEDVAKMVTNRTFRPSLHAVPDPPAQCLNHSACTCHEDTTVKTPKKESQQAPVLENSWVSLEFQMAVSYSLRHWRCWSWPQKETKGDQNCKRAPPSHHLLETSLVRKCEKMRRKTNMRDRLFFSHLRTKRMEHLEYGYALTAYSGLWASSASNSVVFSLLVQTELLNS